MNAPAKVLASPASVYAKIAAVQGELAKVGISKSRKNHTPGQNYNFRGIDEVYNTLAPLMAEHGLCIIPRMVAHSLTERGRTKNGNVIWSAVVTAEFDFVSSDDGSIHTARTIGEAMDSSDKASNKAMSAAYKYAALMTFAIPTEGDNDADAQTHEVVADQGQSQRGAVSPDPQAVSITLVTDEQMVRIQSLVQATNSNVGAICKAARVDNLEQLSTGKADNVISRLETKLADMAKAETNSLADEIGDQIPY